MSDHERIWLQADDDRGSEGRLWCQDKVWPECDEDSEPTEYVRADLFAEAQAEVARLREALKWALDELDGENEYRRGDQQIAAHARARAALATRHD